MFAATGCNREQQKPASVSVVADDTVVAANTLLATIPDMGSPSSSPAIPSHGANQQSAMTIVINEKGRGAAFICEKDGKSYVVHNGVEGKAYPGEISHLKLSPDGRRVAYSVRVDGKRRMVLDGREGKLFDDVWEAVFSPDNRHIAYIAKLGEKVHMVADDNMTREGTRSYNGNPIFSADSAKIAYVEDADAKRKARFFISDLSFRNQNVKESIGRIMAVNGARTRIAAVKETDTGQRVIEFSFDKPDVVKEGPSCDSIDLLVFAQDDMSVAYVAQRGRARVLALDGKEERLQDGQPLESPVVLPAFKGAGILLAKENGCFLQLVFTPGSTHEKQYEEAAELVYNKDGSCHAYTARSGKNWFVVLNGREGPAFDRVVTPRFSPDGTLLTYRARNNGKRFLVVSDLNGKIISMQPNYEMVFPQVFTSDGKSVAYGVKEGNNVLWKVEKL
jgi:hypothetical protein